MNTLYIVLTVIAGLIFLTLLVAAIAPRGYHIQRSITIGKPIHEVFDYLRHLKNQDRYNKWVMTDPTMKKSYIGTDGTRGFVYQWDGNQKAGAGEQEILSIETNQQIDTVVRFRRPFKGVAHSHFITDAMAPADTTTTRVQWTFSSTLKYPANIFLLIMNAEKVLGKDLETSLSTLKKVLEQ